MSHSKIEEGGGGTTPAGGGAGGGGWRAPHNSSLVSPGLSFIVFSRKKPLWSVTESTPSEVNFLLPADFLF